MTENENLRPLAALFLIGMTVPLLVSFLLADTLSLYLSGRQFSYLAAALFTLVAWAVLAYRDLDRVDFLVAAVVLPWVEFLGLIFVGFATGGDLQGFDYLFHHIEDAFAYAAAFVVAGIAAVVLNRRAIRLSEQYGGPAPRRLATGALLVIALILLLGGAVAHVTASSASVSAVEPGIADYRTPALNMTVDGAPSELRLTVTSPGGDTYTKRVSPATRRDSPSTVSVGFHRLGGYPVAGTYHVQLTSLTGISVDSATYTLENTPSPSLLGVQTAGSGEALRFDLPPDSMEYRPSAGATDSNPRVGVILQNDGDVAAEFDVRLLLGEKRVTSRDIFLEPGQQGANVLALSDTDFERIHAEANGTVTAEVSYGDDRERTDAQLPDP